MPLIRTDKSKSRKHGVDCAVQPVWSHQNTPERLLLPTFCCNTAQKPEKNTQNFYLSIKCSIARSGETLDLNVGV